MRRYLSWNDVLVMPDDLRAYAWSAPMRDLAAGVGMSDVGLRKLLAPCGVAPPPQGHWNKLRAGKPVLKVPRSPPRRPGETGRIRLDQRFAKVFPVVEPMPWAGPFASRAVPEDLEELRALELKALGRVAMPRTGGLLHRGLHEIHKREKKRAEKVAQSSWHWDAPKFETPLDRRRLRLLNGIFLGLAKRGHDGYADDRDAELTARAIVGDTHLTLSVAPAGKCRMTRQNGYMRPAPDLPASTPLQVIVDPDRNGRFAASWSDDGTGVLEKRLADIVAGIIVAGEASFRRGLREAEERREQAMIDAERRRQERLAELNKQRVEHLYKSGTLFRQATDLRALVAAVAEALRAGRADLGLADLEAWQAWALAEADKIDPVMSGQVLSHLLAPKLNDIATS